MKGGYHLADEAHQRAYDSRLMARLLRFMAPYKTATAAAILLLLVVSLLGSATPLINKYTVDLYINNPARAAATDADTLALIRQQDQIGLVRIVVLVGVVVLLQTIAGYIQSMLVAYVGQKTMFDMRMAVFEHIQRMSLRFLDRNPVGRLMTRVTHDIETIEQNIVSGTVSVANDLFTVFVIIGFMLWLNWQLALVALSTAPFVFISSVIFRKYARATYLDIRKAIASLNAFLQEHVAGMRVVQAFGRETRCRLAFEDRASDVRDKWLQQVRNHAIYRPIVEFWSSFSIALIILYIGFQLIGKPAVVVTGASVGTLFAYMQWAERLYGPIRALADRYNQLLEAMASSERIFSLLDTPEDVKDDPDAAPCPVLQGKVEFRNVSFSYDGEHKVIHNLNFAISPGERIAIVGHTGAGKTTISSLLSRFYDIQEGEILLDGLDIRRCEQRSLRRQIGVVLQDVFLFAGSVEDNIRLGDMSMPREHIEICARHVNAARFIEKLQGGYGHDVGERGCNLSTGQRQLLAFARTLAHGPRILVLDEATSSVDTETEFLIQDAIAKLMADRTSIVIAHRLSTVRRADRILVMHHGVLREEGTHQELLAKGGLYHRLYQLQYKEQDASA